MGWKEGIEELEPIMTMWVFNIMYLQSRHSDEVFEKYKPATTLSQVP